MAIVFKNKKLNEKDVKMLTAMLEGLFDTHIAKLKEIDTGFYDDQDQADRWINYLKDIYTREKKALHDSLIRMSKSKQTFYAEQILNNAIPGANAKFWEKIKTENDPNHITLSVLINDFFQHEGDFDIMSKIPGVQGENSEKYYDIAAGDFKLDNIPIDGIDKIADYEPEKGNSNIFNDAMMKNSNTLRKAKGEQAHKVKAFEQAAEWARKKSIELKNKEDISAGDLTEAFLSYNKILRPDDPDAGKFRNKDVEISGTGVHGVATKDIPADIFKIMRTVAESMNQIKNCKDKNLRKSQAIQLAGFAFQMTVSAHVFEDGNGRSCRLFADTILQAFNLPPHTPTKEELKVAHTIDDKTVFEFSNVKNAFFKGVKASSDAVKTYRETHPKHNKNRDARETAQFMDALLSEVNKAKGYFGDSDQYITFSKAVLACKSIAAELHRSRNRNAIKLAAFDRFGYDFALKSFKKGTIQNGCVDQKTAQALLNRSYEYVQNCAQKYVNYKLTGRTANPALDMGKEKLNSADWRKIGIMNLVLPKENRVETMNRVQPAAKPAAVNAAAA